MKALLISFASIMFLASCATSQQEGNGQSFGANLTEKINASFASVNNALSGNKKKTSGTDDPSNGRIHLRDTGLKDIIANSNSDQWPRIALTVNKLPKWFYTVPPGGKQGHYGPHDCIDISLTVWRDQKNSQSYDNLDFCGDDIVTNIPYSDIGITWTSFGMVTSGQHTGSQRTKGPLPPQRLFPNKPGLDMFFQFNGNYYVGGIMSTLGYNWKEPRDARFWIVNVPTQAEVMH